MTDEIIDLLKIKIENAKRKLPLETVNAIEAVDWRATILELRTKKGYTFEQLGDLELETELLLCGLVSGEDYPKELENRMKISKAAANELVNEMNDLVFKKIREELVKNIERKKIFQKSEQDKKKDVVGDTQVLNSAGIKIIPDLPTIPPVQLMQTEKLELTTTENREDILQKIEKPEGAHPILVQKLSASFQIPIVKTEHSLENITKITNEIKTPVPQAPKSYPKNADPYRLPSNE